MKDATFVDGFRWFVSEEASVDEERYVVRDGEGVLVTSTEDAVSFHHDHPPSRTLATTRGDAVATLKGVRKEFPRFGPYTLYRLVKKPKPKAPREVFVLVDADANFAYAVEPQYSRDEANDEIERLDDDSLRVVRYVLAEGE
jgi:hypothetical protein